MTLRYSPKQNFNHISKSKGVKHSPKHQYTSPIEYAILQSNMPLLAPDESNYDQIEVDGHRGLWLNRDESANWQGYYPLCCYPINRDLSPDIVRKKPQQSLEYIQELTIRYLKVTVTIFKDY
jgi:hypothetical protein